MSTFCNVSSCSLHLCLLSRAPPHLFPLSWTTVMPCRHYPFWPACPHHIPTFSLPGYHLRRFCLNRGTAILTVLLLVERSVTASSTQSVRLGMTFTTERELNPSTKSSSSLTKMEYPVYIKGATRSLDLPSAQTAI